MALIITSTSPITNRFVELALLHRADRHGEGDTPEALYQHAQLLKRTVVRPTRMILF